MQILNQTAPRADPSSKTELGINYGSKGKQLETKMRSNELNRKTARKM
jgi:hypothetical protein